LACMSLRCRFSAVPIREVCPVRSANSIGGHFYRMARPRRQPSRAAAPRLCSSFAWFFPQRTQAAHDRCPCGRATGPWQAVPRATRLLFTKKWRGGITTRPVFLFFCARVFCAQTSFLVHSAVPEHRVVRLLPHSFPHNGGRPTMRCPCNRATDPRRHSAHRPPRRRRSLTA